MFGRISLTLRELLSRQDGQAATEYALILVFLVVGLGVSVGALGVSFGSFFGEVAAAIDTVIP